MGPRSQFIVPLYDENYFGGGLFVTENRYTETKEKNRAWFAKGGAYAEIRLVEPPNISYTCCGLIDSSML
jgi:hypothetical protein